MSNQITKINQKEAELAAKMYVAGFFVFSDSFSTDTRNGEIDDLSTREVNVKVQKEIDKIVAKLLKNIDIDFVPTSSYDCIMQAKALSRK